MSSTTEWRKLADTYGLPAKQYAEALRAAADRVDELEAGKETRYEDELLFELKRLKAKLDHCANRHFEQKERAARAEAELADLKEMAATDQRCAEALAEQGFLRTESLWDQVISALNALHNTKAELARVTAEAAVMREALDTYAQYHENGETALVSGFLAKRALSSTSAGAGLLTSPRSTPSYEAP